MKQKQGVYFRRSLVAVALGFAFAGGAWAHPPKQCGSNVSQQGKTITVKPTGISDTANLQCAINLAVVGGRGSVVQLTRGKFYTAQLVAKNLKGTIRGEGMKWVKGKEPTIIQNLPGLCVTPDNFFLSPPTPPPSPCPQPGQPFPAGKNPWPHMLAVDGGDVVVSDLAIQIDDPKPTKGYTLSAFFQPNTGPTFTSLSAAIGATGTNPRLRVARVSLSGVLVPDDLLGTNVHSGVLFQGGIAPGTELSGYYEVTDSYSKNIASAASVATVKDATIVVENNTFDSVLWAGTFDGLTNTDLKFVKNKVSSILGVVVEDFALPPATFTDSRLFIAHNTFSSQIPGVGGAIGITATFNGKTSCLVVLNDTTGIDLDPPLYPIFLGPGTRDCLVVTRDTRPGGAVNDLGKNNRVITVPRR